MEKPAQKRRNKSMRIILGTRNQDEVFLLDDEIAELIPCLSLEELAQLERSLLVEGCREPLTVWDDGRRKTLVDGHNRFDICCRHNLPYRVRTIQLPDRAAALRWVAEHQLGRRNLAPEAYAYLRGKLYNSMKSQGARRDLTSGHSAQKSTTAHEIAAQYKVDEKTIRRDGHFAEQLDQLAELVGADVKNTVLARGARISRRDVGRLIELETRVRRRILADVKEGAKASVLLREALGAAERVSDKKAKTPGTTPHGARTPSLNVESATARGAGALPGAFDVDATAGGVEAAFEHLGLAAIALRRAARGSISTERIACITERVQEIDAVLEAHRRVAPPRSGAGVRRADGPARAPGKGTDEGSARSLIASTTGGPSSVVRGDAIESTPLVIADGFARGGGPDLFLALEPQLVLLRSTLQRSPAKLLGKAELCEMVSQVIDFLRGRNDGSFLSDKHETLDVTPELFGKALLAQVRERETGAEVRPTRASPLLPTPLAQQAARPIPPMPTAATATSAAAALNVTRHEPTPEEIAAVISQLVDEYKNGHLRLPFEGELALLRKRWPRPVTTAALAMFFRMLNDLPVSEHAATTSQFSARVPGTAAVGAESPAPRIGPVTSRASASARAAASASRGPSTPGTRDMTQAAALAWATPLTPGISPLPAQSNILTIAARSAGIGSSRSGAG
jgi:hypothetical protein